MQFAAPSICLLGGHGAADRGRVDPQASASTDWSSVSALAGLVGCGIAPQVVSFRIPTGCSTIISRGNSRGGSGSSEAAKPSWPVHTSITASIQGDVAGSKGLVSLQPDDIFAVAAHGRLAGAAIASPRSPAPLRGVWRIGRRAPRAELARQDARGATRSGRSGPRGGADGGRREARDRALAGLRVRAPRRGTGSGDGRNEPESIGDRADGSARRCASPR